MSSINNDYNSIDNIIRRERQSPKLPSAMSSSAKDFKNMIEAKKRQTQSSESELEEELTPLQDSDLYSQNRTQDYQAIKLSAKQVKILQELEVETKETTSELQLKIDEANQMKRNQAAKNLENKNELKNEQKQLDNKTTIQNAATRKEVENEMITVDLTAQEIKELQSSLKKQSSTQDTATKDLLKQLEGALQQVSQKQPPQNSPLASAAKEMQNKPTTTEHSPLRNPVKETPPSPLQAIMQTNRDHFINKKNISKENIDTLQENLKHSIPQQDEKKPLDTLGDVNVKEEVQKERLSSLDQTQIAKKSALETKDIKMNDENNDLKQSETSSTNNTNNIVMPPLPNTAVNPANFVANDQKTQHDNQAMKNSRMEVETTKSRPEMQNRAIENQLNERFISRKSASSTDEKFEGSNKNEASSSKSSESSSTAKASRKLKDSETRSVEAETSAALSATPAQIGNENNVQLQSNNQEIPRESLLQLVNELVKQILVIKTQGQTDTLVTLRSPKVLEDATIKISTFDQAKGEINITFGNLTPEAQKLLEKAKEGLITSLKEQSIITHNIIITRQAETPYLLPERQVNGQQDDSKRKNK